MAIQGVGKVGAALARLLDGEGCELVVADAVPEVAAAVAARFGAAVVPPDRVLFEPCDIVSPCALGGVLDTRTISDLDCAAVVGAANNQLADDSCAERIDAAGVLYAPDFVVNAGGVINISEELHPDGYSAERALARVARIGEATTRIVTAARQRGQTTLAAAHALAEERLAAASALP